MTHFLITETPHGALNDVVFAVMLSAVHPCKYLSRNQCCCNCRSGEAQDRNLTSFPHIRLLQMRSSKNPPFHTNVNTPLFRIRHVSIPEQHVRVTWVQFSQEFLFFPLFYLFLSSRLMVSKHVGAACVGICKRSLCLYCCWRSLFLNCCWLYNRIIGWSVCVRSRACERWLVFLFPLNCSVKQ